MRQYTSSNQPNNNNPNHPNHLNYIPSNLGNPVHPSTLQTQQYINATSPNMQNRIRIQQYQTPNLQQVSAYSPINTNPNSLNHHTISSASRVHIPSNIINSPQTFRNTSLVNVNMSNVPLINTGGYTAIQANGSGHITELNNGGGPERIRTGQPSIQRIQIMSSTDSNFDDIDNNLQEIKRIKAFIEKVHVARFEIEDILKILKKQNNPNLPKLMEESMLKCEVYRKDILNFATKSALLSINPYQEENDIKIGKDEYKFIENELDRLKKRDSIENFNMIFSGLRQYFSIQVPNLFEFYIRTKNVSFIPFFELQLQQLKTILTNISNRQQRDLVFLSFEPDWNYNELDEIFYVSIIQLDLLTLTLSFKKSKESYHKLQNSQNPQNSQNSQNSQNLQNSQNSQNSQNKNLSSKNDETVIFHSFIVSTLFDGHKTLKGLKNKSNKKYYMSNMFNNFNDKAPEELVKLRELVINNYDQIDLPCFYPRTKLFQQFNKLLTYNDIILYSRNKEPLSTIIEETLKYCNIFSSKCAICNEKIQLDFKDLLMPIHMRDKNEKYSHLGCWKSNFRSMGSTLSIEIPLAREEKVIGRNLSSIIQE